MKDEYIEPVRIPRKNEGLKAWKIKYAIEMLEGDFSYKEMAEEACDEQINQNKKEGDEL